MKMLNTEFAAVTNNQYHDNTGIAQGSGGITVPRSVQKRVDKALSDTI